MNVKRVSAVLLAENHIQYLKQDCICTQYVVLKLCSNLALKNDTPYLAFTV